MKMEWRNFSANSLLIPEVWGSRCGVACGPRCRSTMPLWRAREPFPDAKKALESERTRTDDRAFRLWLVAAPNRCKSALFNSNRFPLILLFQFLSFLRRHRQPAPRPSWIARSRHRDATNRRIPHHQVTSVPSVCPSVDHFPRFQNCERCASERGRSEIWWMDCGGKDVCMGRNWNWK